MLINLYLFALILGGVLLVASIFMGGDEGDSDTTHGEVDTSGMGGFFGALLSLRFWTFSAAFFGLTGLVFDGLDLVEGFVLPLVLAIAVGLATGFITTVVLRSLHRGSSGSVPTAQAYAGKTGRVLVGFGPGELGKVRLDLGGTTVDALARTEETQPFAPGDEAFIIEMQQNNVLVARLRASPHAQEATS